MKQARSMRVVAAIAVVLALWWTFPRPACAQETQWLTGKDYDRVVLGQLPLVTWTDAPIRDALTRLSRSQKVAVFLDRRVDPELPLNGTYDGDTFFGTLQTAVTSGLLMSEGLAVSQVGNVLYVGHSRFTVGLQTLLSHRKQEAGKLPETGRRVWTRPQTTLRWETPTSPKDLLAEVAKKNRLRVRNTTLIPHDLWEPGNLPPMSLVEAFTLLLGQFDLTFQFELESDPSGATVSIRRLRPADLEQTRRYPQDRSRANKRAVIESALPGTRFAEVGDQLEVTGIVEAHDFLTSSRPSTDGVWVGGFLPKPAKTAPVPANRDSLLFSGAIRGEFIPILRQFCEQNGYTLEYNADALYAAGRNPSVLVSVPFQQKTIRAIIAEVCQAGGCHVVVEGNTVFVEP